MRLWASVDSITFDEFSPQLGGMVEVALGLSLSYVGEAQIGHRHSGFPCDFSSLGDAGFVQIPALGRASSALTGTLRLKSEEQSLSFIESAFTAHVLRPSGSVEQSIARLGTARGTWIEALGDLHISGQEMSTKRKVFYPARIHRFRSICLKADDPRFGQWFDVQLYGDLGSDPDVIGETVCVTEFDLFI